MEAFTFGSFFTFSFFSFFSFGFFSGFGSFGLNLSLYHGSGYFPYSRIHLAHSSTSG